MTMEEYFGDWLKVIDKKELQKVVSTVNGLYQTQDVMPRYEDIFKAFHLCPYNELKAVFIGQDPYPQMGVATGILFGNKEDAKELSPSLEVVKESCVDYTMPHNTVLFDITFESWVKQGILMINSALTVQLNTPNSHTMVWRPFMSKLLASLSIHESNIAYVLFGKQAHTFEPYINSKYNLIIKEMHPAYYARINSPMPSKLFKDVNSFVKNIYGKPIEWYKEL